MPELFLGPCHIITFFISKYYNLLLVNIITGVRGFGKEKTKQDKNGILPFILLSGLYFMRGSLGGLHYFFAFVEAAFGAYAVGHLHLVALGAFDVAGGGELPVGAALVAARFGHFTRWYCHGLYPPPWGGGDRRSCASIPC
jgi:hypothetical protein